MCAGGTPDVPTSGAVPRRTGSDFFDDDDEKPPGAGAVRAGVAGASRVLFEYVALRGESFVIRGAGGGAGALLPDEAGRSADPRLPPDEPDEFPEPAELADPDDPDEPVDRLFCASAQVGAARLRTTIQDAT